MSSADIITQILECSRGESEQRSSDRNLAGIIRLCAAMAPLLATGLVTSHVEAAQKYTPTQTDLQSIQDALERYLKGFDTSDNKLVLSAFWDEAVVAGPSGEISAREMFAAGVGAPPTGAAPPAGGPPPGGAPQAGPPAGASPPAGAGSPGPGQNGGTPYRPPSCGADLVMPAQGWGLWHIVANSHLEFESPTRVRHHAYLFAVCPGAGSLAGVGVGTIGPPGHYSDILEKRHGEWRIIYRETALNTKY